MYRILITGDRNWNSGKAILRELEAIGGENIEVVIHGNARGADTLGDWAARKLGIEVMKFPADWKTYGKAAGPIRNRKQFDEGKPNLVLAFHADIEKSIGTKDMIGYAESKGCEVRLFTE